MSPLSLDVLFLPGIGPDLLDPIKKDLSRVDITLLMDGGFEEKDVAPWTRLPRFGLQVMGGDLSGMPEDLPQRLERIGRSKK